MGGVVGVFGREGPWGQGEQRSPCLVPQPAGPFKPPQAACRGACVQQLPGLLGCPLVHHRAGHRAGSERRCCQGRPLVSTHQSRNRGGVPWLAFSGPNPATTSCGPPCRAFPGCAHARPVGRQSPCACGHNGRGHRARCVGLSQPAACAVPAHDRPVPGLGACPWRPMRL